MKFLKDMRRNIVDNLSFRSYKKLLSASYIRWQFFYQKNTDQRLWFKNFEIRSFMIPSHSMCSEDLEIIQFYQWPYPEWLRILITVKKRWEGSLLRYENPHNPGILKQIHSLIVGKNFERWGNLSFGRLYSQRWIFRLHAVGKIPKRGESKRRKDSGTKTPSHKFVLPS